jgi:hypothetical protein
MAIAPLHFVELDPPLKTPEGYAAAVNENKIPACNELAHDVGDQNLAGLGTCADAKGSMYRRAK